MAGRFSVEAVFKAVDRFSAPISRMQNRVGKLTRSMRRGFDRANRAVDKFGRGLKSVGRSMALVGGAIALVSANIIAAGAGFGQAITDVGAVSLKTREEIAPLEKLALELGRTTKFTSTQAANAMEILARAGFTANQILSVTPSVLSGAAASGLEIAEMADITSNVLKGMGLEVSETVRVVDALAFASTKTNTTIGSLGEGMKGIASTARQLGLPLEEVIASIALLQDVGLDASVSSSAFNTMLTKMAAPTVGMQKKMKKLGITFKDVATGDMLLLPQVLEQLSKASERVGGNFDQVAFLAELVGLRGQKAAANLIKLHESGKHSELVKQLLDVQGVSEKIAAIRMNTFTGSMLLLGSAVDAVKVKIFGLNDGPLKDAVDNMTRWVGANEDLIATNVTDFLVKIIDNFESIVTWAERIGIALVVFFTLATTLKAVAFAMTLVNLALVPGALTFGLIVLAIIAVIIIIAAVIFWWDELSSAFMNSSGAMDIFIIGIGFILGPIGLLIAAALLIIKHWEPIKKFFKDLWGGVVNIFNSSIDKIMNVVDKVKNAVSGVMDTISTVGGEFGDLFRFGVDGTLPSPSQESTSPQVVSPQERVARSIEERSTTSTAEVTIRDESGRAELTGGRLGLGLSLQKTGDM